MKRGLTRFWYRFKNWFRTKPGPGERLRFLCGSEEELRWVTTWICHLHPDLFRLCRNGCLEVHYWGRCKDLSGHGRVVWNPWESPPHEPKIDITAANNLLALAFIHNEFIFTRWIGREDKIFTRCYEIPDDIVMQVAVPSAHERAEALLALSEWLDGKVSEQEKRELLQLSDDMEIQ